MLGTRVPLLVLPLLFLLPPIPRVLATAPNMDAPARSADQFRFSPAAKAQLHGLWVESIRAKQERVACLGGTVADHIVNVATIRQLVSETRDSTQIVARESIRICRPPEWLGTVHSHIATFNGLPYVTFSPNDRIVMSLWHREWKESGVFCVLYTRSAAHCELGEEISGDPIYGDDVDDSSPTKSEPTSR